MAEKPAFWRSAATKGTTTNYRSGAEVLDGWRDDVLSGKPPTYYLIGEGELSRLQFGPGL